MDWIEVVGVAGAGLVLFGFYRTSIGRWTSTSFWYELDNLLGAILLSIYHIATETYAPLVVNVVWAIVAFRGITSFAERRGRATPTRSKKRR